MQFKSNRHLQKVLMNQEEGEKIQAAEQKKSIEKALKRQKEKAKKQRGIIRKRGRWGEKTETAEADGAKTGAKAEIAETAEKQGRAWTQETEK